MIWSAQAPVVNGFSPVARRWIIAGMCTLFLLRCVLEYMDAGFTPAFWLYAVCTFVSLLLEWKASQQPQRVILTLYHDRLVFENPQRYQTHTVYAARTQWIKADGSNLIFYGASSIAQTISLAGFSPTQQQELLQHLHSWGKKMTGLPAQHA